MHAAKARRFVTERCSRLAHTAVQTDRFDRAIQMAVASAVASLVVVPALTIVALCVAAIVEYEPETPEEIFRRVVGVHAGRFEAFDYYWSEGIECEYCFKFEFSDSRDIDAIIESNDLSRTVNILTDSSFPQWYREEGVSPFGWGRHYSRSIGDSVYRLYVDDWDQVAYFDFVST